jgi:hypothetical protein
MGITTVLVIGADPESMLEPFDENAEVEHRVCTCRENVALCGQGVADEDLIEYDAPPGLPGCVSCVAATPWWICPVCLHQWDEEREE